MTTPTLPAMPLGPPVMEGGLLDVQQRLLQRLAEPGLDMTAARAELADRRRRRRSTQCILGGCAGVFLVALCATVLAVWPDSEPEQVLADKDDTSERSTTTVIQPAAPDTTAVPVESIPILVAPTTLAPTTTVPATTAPVETAPPTTVAPNRQLAARLEVRTPQIAAGDLVEVVVNWTDDDLGVGAVAPRYIVDWGDPLVAAMADTSPVSPCDVAGIPATGSETLRFRYSTPGRHTVRVRLETCGGQGAYADRLDLTGEVDVSAPIYRDPLVADDPGRQGRAVVVFRPLTAGAAAPPSFDTAQAEYVATANPATPIVLRVTGAVSQFTTSGPAQVLVVPFDAAGTIRMRWTEPALCLATSDGALVAPTSSGSAATSTPPASIDSTDANAVPSLPLNVTC